MFNVKHKTIERKDIPRGSLWIYDNYEKIIEKNNIDPSFVTEAIWDKNKREILKLNLKDWRKLKCKK